MALEVFLVRSQKCILQYVYVHRLLLFNFLLVSMGLTPYYIGKQEYSYCSQLMMTTAMSGFHTGF